MAKGRIGELNKHSTQFGGSQTRGGQVQVHHTATGDRRNGVNASRGHESPIGGVDNRFRGDMSKPEERKDRAQSPRRGGPLEPFKHQPDRPI